MWLGFGLISGRREEIRMNHIRVMLVFKKLSGGIFFHGKLKEPKVREFLTVQQDSLSIHEIWFEIHQTFSLCSDDGYEYEKHIELICS